MLSRALRLLLDGGEDSGVTLSAFRARSPDPDPEPEPGSAAPGQVNISRE